uniref:Cytochrome P450 78A1 n=1 Tax=Zea mays TaxID=4577 RepID=C78A1_MAIZE|nr:RecName: Full=Cytochrome P450 78A1; AltName: Full=CYPLXXVIII [Zea mays]AAA61607.1 cytochrome P-450 [Zea mays]
MAMASAACSCTDGTWWVYALPALLGSDTLCAHPALLAGLIFLATVSVALLAWATSPGGPAWTNGRGASASLLSWDPVVCPCSAASSRCPGAAAPRPRRDGPRRRPRAKELMAFSVGDTPAVVSSCPATAREVLAHPSFADRPVKRSARELMFARAIGFAPNGEYWRRLRRVASTHLFSPRRVASHEPGRQGDAEAMLRSIAAEQSASGAVALRPHLQAAALNNIMGSVFGTRYDVTSGAGAAEAEHLKSMVREGFELLGAFNWSDHLPWLAHLYDPSNVTRRCAALVPRVQTFVRGVIDEHRRRRQNSAALNDNADFVDVLLSLEGDEKLGDDDMVAILWEMVFRGTDTTALLTEWCMAELVRHPAVQARVRAEVDAAVGAGGCPTDADVARMPYLQAVVKETLRAHPPGPLLSWARLATADVPLCNGMVVPAGTTAMVNMWAITHDAAVWADPDAFAPERFLPSEGGADVDVRGVDLRLAPFGAGRRVCPGKNLGLTTVGLWVARLVHAFQWALPDGAAAVCLDEVLKLSLEMKTPLVAAAIPRTA